MIARKLAPWCAACLLSTVMAAGARATEDAYCDGCCEHDLQFFAPVDFDFDCMPMQRECGLFFNYSRLAWAATGERTTIGVPGLQVPSEQIYQQNPFDEGFAAQPYTVSNGVQDAPPDAKFGWGHRYELGYFSCGNGWLIGILDGPRITSQMTYGFQELTFPGTLPLITQTVQPNWQNFNINLTGPDTGLFTGGYNPSSTQNGFGSVHVNFEVPQDFLLGFRDYHVNGPNNEPSPTTGGPWFQITSLTTANGQVTAFTASTGADGIVDDIDGDGETFGFVFQDSNGNGSFDDGEPILGTFVDHDDLYMFNTRFNTLAVKNFIRTDGIEIMRTLEIDNSHLPVKEQRNHFDIAYGARYFRIQDEFSWDGDIDIAGRTYQDTFVRNNIVGPQIRARWTHQRHRLTFDLDGRFTFGYNVQNLDQKGGFGQSLIPGGLNRPVNAQPTFFASGRQDNDFSPLAELRAEARYQFSGALAAKLGYTGIFVDNITRASQVVHYRLPDMGLLEGGQQNMYINGVDFGFELVY